MINGLRGNNVKLASKPPVPPKAKSTNSNVLNSKLQNSPYLSSVVQNPNSPAPRRVQSATTIRGQNNVSSPSSAPKPPVFRKQSEPAIKIPNKILTVKPKLFAAQQQKVRQRQQSSESERSVADSLYSSNSTVNSKNKTNFKGPKLRPVTVPNDVHSNSPHEDVIQMMMMMGDVESFEDFVDFDFDRENSRSNNPSALNKSKKRPFSFSSDNYALDFNSLSLNLDISEQPEEFLRDHNVNERGDYSRQGQGLLQISGRKSPSIVNGSPKGTKLSSTNAERSCSPLEFQNEVKSLKNSPNPRNSSYDQNILSQSDNLLHDVVKLCDEIGLDASILEKIKNSSRFISPQKTSSSLNDLQNAAKKLLDFDIEEELADMSCPSTVRNQSGPDSSGRNLPDDDVKEKIPNSDSDNNKSSTQAQNSSRPISGNSRRSSLGIDYSETYTRILAVLRHIEEEEKKSLNKIEVNVQSPAAVSPNSSLPIPCSTADCSSLSQPTFHRKYPENDGDNNGNHNSQPIFLQISPRSCSCASEQCCLSARSQANKKIIQSLEFQGLGENVSSRPRTTGDIEWETTDEKTKNLFSFLDEVEKSDRATLFTLKFEQPPSISGQQGLSSNPTASSNIKSYANSRSPVASSGLPLQTMDTLIRKGSVELAREVIILERKLDETQHNVNLLEETLVNQRELNVRNLKNSERDLKKRLKLQQEEFELALSRHQTFVDQLIAEKRSLQDKCEKVLRDSKENEQKYQEQIRSLQEKHLEEIKRIRKIQQNSENMRKQKWVGNKTQEIRDMTVKGLEPEVQRIIQRHQQEMSEMRAWHSDELREVEERYQRKQNMQLQEIREQFIREKEDLCRREREMANKRLESELKQREDEFESQKRRIMNELNEERERYACDEIKLKDSMQENIRKAQIKGEVEIDNIKQEYETKLLNIDRRHENELKSLKDVYEAQKENWVSNYTKKLEQTLADKESEVAEAMRLEKEREIREKEKKLRDEFDKLRMEDEVAAEGRVKRLQDKFHGELIELEKSERDLKCRLSQSKADLLAKDEELFTLKTTLNLKEKSNSELQEANMRMLEERANLTSVIRREFASQIESLEEDCRTVKSNVLELQAKQKLELEQHQMEIEKIRNEKDAELEKVGLRVKQALLRKEETLQELQKQLEKASYRINHLEELLEQQRKDFVQSISVGNSSSTSKRK